MPSVDDFRTSFQVAREPTPDVVLRWERVYLEWRLECRLSKRWLVCVYPTPLSEVVVLIDPRLNELGDGLVAPIRDDARVVLGVAIWEGSQCVARFGAIAAAIR
jgi:hypothetical protein